LTKSHHSFYAEEELSIFINELATKYNSKIEMFVDIFTKLQKKEIILGEPSIKEKQEVQKLANMKKINSKMDISMMESKSKIVNLNADTELKKSIVARYKLSGLPLPKHVQLMDNEIQKDYSKNPLHSQGLQCIECGIVHNCTMDNLEDRKKCRENYVDHIISKHKRLKLILEEEVKLNEFIVGLEIAG